MRSMDNPFGNYQAPTGPDIVRWNSEADFNFTTDKLVEAYHHKIAYSAKADMMKVNNRSSFMNGKYSLGYAHDSIELREAVPNRQPFNSHRQEIHFVINAMIDGLNDAFSSIGFDLHDNAQPGDLNVNYERSLVEGEEHITHIVLWVGSDQAGPDLAAWAA